MEKFLIALLLGFGLGLLISIISPFIYRHYRPQKSSSGKRKIMVDRPALILIFVVLIAATAFSWQTTKYNAARSEGATDNQYVDKLYPVYNSQYDLVSVVDQNTLDLDSNGKASRIKLIGTGPFSGSNPDQTACYSKEANAKLAGYLSGKKMELEADTALPAGLADSTLPRYIVVNDENINKKMIAEGYAIEFGNGADYRYQTDFLAAQENAKNNKLGFWSGNFCPVKTNTAATPKSSSPKPSGAAANTPSTASSGSSLPINNPRGTSNVPACSRGVPVVTPLLNGLLNRC